MAFDQHFSKRSFCKSDIPKNVMSVLAALSVKGLVLSKLCFIT